MSTVAIDRTHGSTATTELLVLEPVAERLGLAPVLLMPGEIHFGSGPECQVRLPVPGVQELHCILNCSRSRISVRAVDRRTWINNLALSEGRLKLGDRLAIGPVEYRVRKGEPWDILPTPEPLPVAKPIIMGIPVKSEPESIERVDARLLQQIADLEAEISRHQAAVARLERPLADVAEAPNQVGVDAASIHQVSTEVTTPVLSQPSPQVKPASPVFRLSPVAAVLKPVVNVANDGVDEGGVGRDELASLRAELKSQQDQVSRQLAELAVREAGFDRQCEELAAQWDQVRTLLNREDAAAIERGQRDQELSEREQRCTVRESAIVDREQQLGQLLEQVREHDARNQAVAAQIADQSALLETHDKSLKEIAGRLTVGRDELEQQRVELEQQRVATDERQAELTRREAACRAKLAVVESNALALHIDRQAAESEWAGRLADLDRKHHSLLTQADELARLRQTLDNAAATADADQAQLANERVRLAAWNDELSLRQADLIERDRDLKAQVSDYQAQSDELEQRQAAWTATDAQSRAWNERLDAEQIRLATWSEELARQQTSLTEHRLQLDSREEQLTRRFLECEQASAKIQADQSHLAAEQTRYAARGEELALQQNTLTEHRLQLDSREEQLTRRFLECEQASAKIQADQSHLAAEQTRYAARGEELALQQAALNSQQQVLDALSLTLSSRSDELQQRHRSWEESVAATQQQQSQLVDEQSRLKVWSGEIEARQSALIEQQRELEAARADFAAAQRASAETATAASAILAAEQVHLEQARQELFLAECELETVEADLDEFETHLQSRAENLTTREVTLNQAECELAWQQRAMELASPLASVADAEIDGLADHAASASIEILSADRDALATELFVRTMMLEGLADHTDIRSVQLRLQSEQVQHDLETCRILHAELETGRQLLAAERLELQQRQIEWQTKQQAWQAEFESRQLRLSDETEQIQSRAGLLQSSSEELAAKWEQLEAERLTLDHDWEQFRTQQTEFAGLRESLELRQTQLADSTAEHLAATAFQAAERSVWEQDMAAARAALRDREEAISRSQAELDRQRHAVDLDREEWELQRKYTPALAAPEPRSTHVLDEISRLEHLVQDELDYDSRSAYGDVAPLSNDWNQDDIAAPVQTAVDGLLKGLDAFDDTVREDELPPETVDEGIPDGEAVYGRLDPVSSIDYGTARSLWTDDSVDTNPPDHDVPYESAETMEAIEPVADADQTVLDLRARLAAMFNLDTPVEDVRTDSVEVDDVPYAEVLESDDVEPEEAVAVSPAQVRIEAPAPRTSHAPPSVAAEPAADEYDSVESYMERLLDRNRKSRAGEEPVAERYVPPSNPAPTPVSTFTAPVEQLPAAEEPALETEPEAEAVRVPAVREPVDMKKIRAGLVNLRQVANVSARHAIARSKWNKMRIRIAVQCLLTGGCWLIGAGIVTGKITGFVAVSAWGWVAILMGAALAVKVLGDVRSIFHGESANRKSAESQSAIAETASTETGDRTASAP